MNINKTDEQRKEKETKEQTILVVDRGNYPLWEGGGVGNIDKGG